MLSQYDYMQAQIFDQRAKSFDKLAWVKDQEFLASILSVIVEFARSYKHRITDYLDVGTGTGEVLRYFAGRYATEQGILRGARGLGIDVSDEMVAIATKKLRNIPNVRVERRSIFDSGLKHKSFDFVVCRNSFHHFDKPGDALFEMWKLLRRWGAVFIIEGVAPSNYTRDKWREVLLLKDAGRNREMVLSEEDTEQFFSSISPLKLIRTLPLSPVPMLVSDWLNNAPLTEDKREAIMEKIDNLSHDPKFSQEFGLTLVRKKPESRKDYQFKKRSILLEFRKQAE